MTECGDFLTKVKETGKVLIKEEESKDPMSMSFGRGATSVNLSMVTINHHWISFESLSEDFLSSPRQGCRPTKCTSQIFLLHI